MKYTVEQHTDATIVMLQGRIDIGVGDIQLRQCLEDVSQFEHRTIILDMHKINYVDSAGIGELVQVQKDLAQNGVQLYLSNLNTKVYGLLDLTRLITVFSIYDSNEDALQSAA